MPRLFISSSFSLRMSIESWCSRTCLSREIISMGVSALQSWRKDDVFSNKNLASHRSSIEWKSNFCGADAMQWDKLKNISLSVWKDFVVCISPASLALLTKPFLFFFSFIPFLVYLFKAFLSTHLSICAIIYHWRWTQLFQTIFNDTFAYSHKDAILGFFVSMDSDWNVRVCGGLDAEN